MKSHHFTITLLCTFFRLKFSLADNFDVLPLLNYFAWFFKSVLIFSYREICRIPYRKKMIAIFFNLRKSNLHSNGIFFSIFLRNEFDMNFWTLLLMLAFWFSFRISNQMPRIKHWQWTPDVKSLISIPFPL